MNFIRLENRVLLIFFLLIIIFVFKNSYILFKNNAGSSIKEKVTALSKKEEVVIQESALSKISVVQEPTPTVESQQAQQLDAFTIEEEPIILDQETIVTPIPITTSVPVAIIAPDTRADELFNAINAYRQSRGLSTLSKSGTLCFIAQSRANENQARGSLSHDGFTNYVHSQSEFTTMSEVLFWADFQASSTYIVNDGWDKSPSHNQAINDPIWRSGCGGIAGNFATFEFGA